MILLPYFIILISLTSQIDPSKTLIIYFSRAGENYSVGTVEKGNTEKMVEYITKVTNIKTFKIIPKAAYPTNYQETLTRANQEKNSNARPEIEDPLTNIDDYDTILLGYPIWHGNLPNIVMTQLEDLDFNGKTIYPFNTHEGSGAGSSISDIKNSAPDAEVKGGFAVKGSDAQNERANDSINNWLKNTLKLEGEFSNNINFINISKSLFLFLLIFI